MSVHSLSTEFESACGQKLDSADELERIELALTHALAEARTRYPGLSLDDKVFAAHLGQLFQGQPISAAEIAKRVTSDIYLACACLCGEDKAVSTFDREVLSTLPMAMSKLKLDNAAQEEVIQRTREKLLVGKDGQGKLSSFSGTGDLRGWVKVIAIRDAIRSARKTSREVSLSDELQSALPSEDLDPDLAYQRRLYRAEFKASFEAAVDELEPRERSLLRQAIVYRANVDQIAVIYQVHRATAARWVAKARENLASKTRKQLRSKLGISESQFQSIVRLVESQMDLSMERLLATAAHDGEQSPDES